MADEHGSSLDGGRQRHTPLLGAKLFAAKERRELSFAQIAEHLGRTEVACAALFYGQAKASDEDLDKLSHLLQVERAELQGLMACPDRGSSAPMPPTEPLIYRLYEVVQNYGPAYKAVMNEKFGDGIMSGVCFKTDVQAEVDETGAQWAVITMKGKWLPFTRF